MISLFQTATGSWHIPSILMAASWLIGTLVAGGFMLANLRVNRDDRIMAFHAQQQAAAKISQLEEITKPKPFKARLTDFLNALDKRILPALATGQTKFTGNFTPAQYADIQRLASEPGAAQYISFHPGTMIMVGSGGQSNPAEFELNPSLVKL